MNLPKTENRKSISNHFIDGNVVDFENLYLCHSYSDSHYYVWKRFNKYDSWKFNLMVYNY